MVIQEFLKKYINFTRIKRTLIPYSLKPLLEKFWNKFGGKGKFSENRITSREK